MALTCESTFHIFFVIYFLFVGWIRAYYTGLANATGETISKLEEGVLLRRIRYSLGLPVLIAAILYVLSPNWMRWSQWEGLSPILRWLGIFICGFGLYLYWWTHSHLGKNFTNTIYIRSKARLVTSGPYRWIRHPMYVSAVLMCVGSALIAANWFIGGLGLVLLIIIMIFRTPIEEKRLLDHYGEAYRQYMEHTDRFFPKIFH